MHNKRLTKALFTITAILVCLAMLSQSGFFRRMDFPIINAIRRSIEGYEFACTACCFWAVWLNNCITIKQK